MDKCKDCVHFGICKKGFPWADGKGGGWCEDFKSTDLVEVVRCKDCKHFADLGVSYGCNGFGGMTKAHPNGFCSYGERKGDGDG